MILNIEKKGGKLHYLEFLLLQLLLLLILLINIINGAVRPPPWADPQLNPCASQPTGWQYIFWPQDGQCYKIFQIGYPCPETMELVPASTRKPRGLKAECRCPPYSALHQTQNHTQCYEIYKRGPCEEGQFFAPQKNNEKEQKVNLNLGLCKNMETCVKQNHIYWPLDGKCYKRHSQGPCPKGQLIDLNADGVSVCGCSNDHEMEKYFWQPSNSCYEHYTRGPCQEHGHLFLPQRVCDCHDQLPHYHQATKKCYELETRGPCKRGHEYIIPDEHEQEQGSQRAQCICKADHVTWLENGNCYRPFTQGPCPLGQILVNSTACMPIPCGKGFLYFPEQQTCYRIGSQGPCQTGLVVTFDFRIRPSVDGISYNGICGCTGLFSESNNCLKEKRSTKTCDLGLVMYKSKCYRLYTQGPCAHGQWLVPNRQRQSKTSKQLAKCDCRPGYTTTLSPSDKKIKCLSPSVSIANYLNRYFIKDE